MRELRIEQGPVVIIQTEDDPGDMGEPRIITEDGATIVFVPSYSLWPASREAGLDAELLRAAMDSVREMNPLAYLDEGDEIDAIAAEYARLASPVR